MSGNLYRLFEAAFPKDRSRAFLETPEGEVYSYQALEALSGRFAALLTTLGAGPGERVAVKVEKSPEALFLYLACLRAGAIYLPINPAYTAPETTYFLEDARPIVFVADPQSEVESAEIAAAAGVASVLTLGADGAGSLMEMAAELEPLEGAAGVAGEDLAAILYTSGTTGRAKGAMLSHDNLASNARALVAAWGFTAQDCLLHALPLFHTHGLFVASHCVLLSGARLLFLPRFEAGAVIEGLAQATVLMGVPTFYTRLVADQRLTPEACAKVRLFVSGSAPLLEETLAAFEARTGHRILERYGMTETGMNTSNPLEGERIPGTVGQPLADVEVRVAGDEGRILPAGEVGVLQVRGPNVFRGYWRRPDKTAEDFTEDGYFVTGDIATIDSAGYVRIVGRAKDLVISGGFNVYPKEVELVVDALDGVLESAVIGLPHPDFGEAVAAVVVPRDRERPPEAASVITAARDRLAAYKAPKAVFVVDALPRNAMGKIQKNALRDSYKGHFTQG